MTSRNFALHILISLLLAPAVSAAADDAAGEGGVSVTFELERPEAKSVAVAGEFNDWSGTPMKRDGEGPWRLVLDLAPGVYGYKFIVDEEWILDPANNGIVEINGVSNSRLVVEEKFDPVDTGPREWTDKETGKAITARLVAVEGKALVLDRDGKEYRLQRDRFLAADRAYVELWEAQAARAAKSLLASASGSRPPNVIFILADDLGRECLGLYGGESYPTPHIDRLAAEGTRFEACYATPMCSPSRVMLMTGRYSFRNYTEWGRMDFGQPTMAGVLKAGGYCTGVFGKWHLGGWEDGAPYGPTRAGFERFATFDYEKVVREGGEIGNQYWETEVWVDGENFRNEGYGPAFYLKQALKFINRKDGEPDRPFFLYYPLVLAHRPFVPTDKAEGTPVQRTARDGELANFPAMVEFIDDIVGSVLQFLEVTDQLDNTFVFFSSDNGTDNVHEAKELRSRYRGLEVAGGKYLPGELGANVPLLVRGPGVPAGRVLGAPVDFTDILPTLCAIAGVEPPRPVDGENLLPMLLGGPETSHDGLAYTWGVFERSSKKYKDPVFFADELIHIVRDRQWKFRSDGKKLFDLEADWREEKRLRASVAPEVRARLGQYLEKLRGEGDRLW